LRHLGTLLESYYLTRIPHPIFQISGVIDDAEGFDILSSNLASFQRLLEDTEHKRKGRVNFALPTYLFLGAFTASVFRITELLLRTEGWFA
jgi:hypothetical protein